ncbi:MAG: hypothetical protein WD016_04590 [Balneolaceae bacterium]
MIRDKIFLKKLPFLLAVASFALITACGGDSPTNTETELDSEAYTYAFNEGQALDNKDTAYRGEHERNVTAEVSIEEMDNGNASVTVKLDNTISGSTYMVHVHDAADPASTPNGTPYNETPNGDIFAKMLESSGGSVSSTNETTIPYNEVISHEGFFVVHDPTQELSTTDLTTYLVLGVFAQSLGAGESSLRTESFSYGFNEGQLLDDDETAYGGDHPRNLSATLLIEEKGNGNAIVTVSLENTLEGFDYMVHAHDAADPATTPNGTPYNETPNGNVFAGMLEGGGSVELSNDTDVSYLELINEYEGFFVVHDPTQDLSTTDLTTYLVLGSFAQDLETAEPKLNSQTFEYSFNEGQALDNPETAYAQDGDHPRTLSATMLVEELLNGRANITVTLSNTLNGETYNVHSHDAADPNTTENGTPYNETPNADVFVAMLEGNGDSVNSSNETEDILYRDLINEYEGFFVVHDPTQDISTTDLTTYLILGLTAR